MSPYAAAYASANGLSDGSAIVSPMVKTNFTVIFLLILKTVSICPRRWFCGYF